MPYKIPRPHTSVRTKALSLSNDTGGGFLVPGTDIHLALHKEPAFNTGLEIPDDEYPGVLHIKRNPLLGPDGIQAEQEFAQQAEADPEKIVADYIKANGKLVDVDQARKLFPAYDENNDSRTRLSMAVQEPASAVTKAVLAKLLTAAPKTGLISIVTGGPASGKSMAINAKTVKATDAIYTSQQSSFEGAQKRINGILQTGRSVSVLFVDRHPKLGMVGVIDRGVATGRVAPYYYVARAHIDSKAAFLKLYEYYRGNPAVRFYAMLNGGSAKDVRMIPIEALPPESLDQDRLETELKNIVDLERERRQGTASAMSDDIYDAITRTPVQQAG